MLNSNKYWICFQTVINKSLLMLYYAMCLIVVWSFSCMVTWKTMRQFLGGVWVGMEGSMIPYYRKRTIRTWIRMSQKVTKTLVVEIILFMFVVTIVSVVAKNMNVILTLGHRKSSLTMIKATKWVTQFKKQIQCSIRLLSKN